MFNLFKFFHRLGISVRNNKRRHRVQFVYVFFDLWALNLSLSRDHPVFKKDVLMVVVFFFHELMLAFGSYHRETIIRTNLLFLRESSECTSVQKI